MKYRPIHRNYKNRIPYKTSLTNQSKINRNSITLKDILIPLLSAIAAVSLNQLFFTSNKISEAKIEYQKEILKTQTPILNRILSFTHEYNIEEVTLINHCKPIVNDNIDKKNIEADTVKFEIPFFLVNEFERKRLMDDLEYVKNNRDNLHHNVYIRLDEVIDFLEYYKPKIYKLDDPSMSLSPWARQDIQQEYTELMTDLRRQSIF